MDKLSKKWFAPSEELSEKQVNAGLKLLVKDGLAAEVMAALTGGTFLVALALSLGASNFQIGLLAALPTLANLFQLLAIYLIHKYANRKAITVICSVLARLPLLLISLLPLFLPPSLGLVLLISLLFIHYFFGAVSGTSWSSWAKDLVPEAVLGTFFSGRSRKIQILSVSLNLVVAFLLDYVKANRPEYVNLVYSAMFFTGGAAGLYGAYVLARIPEPRIHPVTQNMVRLFRRPLRQRNFRNLLIFNGFWSFSVNLAAPFFTVYMLKMLGFPLSYVVIFSIISQVSNILFIRLWGTYSDRYSNKTVLLICAPVYLLCILGWTFTTFPQQHLLTIPLLVLIHIGSGIALSGINLSLGNMGLKLAPDKQNAVIFLSVRSLTNALSAGVAPLVGGLLADFFARRELLWTFEWKSPRGDYMVQALSLQSWDFFFVLAFIMGLFALNRLSYVREAGEVEKKRLMKELRTELRRDARELSTISGIQSMLFLPFSFFVSVMEKVVPKKEGD
ncbi:MFS transporter [Anseongella ginsenosidimutans]|uniref:MFS transporter n=1 Tax=Anseongella ginsenosidimutans TaxID=496056 RepID=A0A4R3KS35_9SPHI|nr:MFS transporter [Anseongella ginsenosidimutans]TCS87249.1 MFS transporter [Anseongella ginsenosidimutans]